MLLKLQVLIGLFFIIGSTLCYRAILERIENVYVNEKYLEYAKFYIKKYSRESPYYLNIAGINKHAWSNNITVIINLKEKLSNMYKPTFVEFRFILCDLLSNDHIFGTMLRGAGIQCPVPPGEHFLQNMTIVMEDFPNVFPFLKGRADVQGEITDTKEVIYTGYVYWSLVRNKSSRGKA